MNGLKKQSVVIEKIVDGHYNSGQSNYPKYNVSQRNPNEPLTSASNISSRPTMYIK